MPVFLPTDRGAWQATVHSVAKSQTQMSIWADCSIACRIKCKPFSRFLILPHILRAFPLVPFWFHGFTLCKGSLNHVHVPSCHYSLLPLFPWTAHLPQLWLYRVFLILQLEMGIIISSSNEPHLTCKSSLLPHAYYIIDMPASYQLLYHFVTLCVSESPLWPVIFEGKQNCLLCLCIRSHTKKWNIFWAKQILI